MAPRFPGRRRDRDAPPQELNPHARVITDPLKPAERLALEQADVPVKPNGATTRDEG